MPHGNDNDFILALFVDRTVRKAVQQAAPGTLRYRLPRKREGAYTVYCRPHFIQKLGAQTWHLIFVVRRVASAKSRRAGARKRILTA